MLIPEVAGWKGIPFEGNVVVSTHQVDADGLPLPPFRPMSDVVLDCVANYQKNGPRFTTIPVAGTRALHAFDNLDRPVPKMGHENDVIIPRLPYEENPFRPIWIPRSDTPQSNV